MPRDLPALPGVTYGELWERAGGLAGALRARGVAPGDRVGLALPRSADAVVAHLAIARAGAVTVALDLDHPEARRREILAVAGARIVIGEDTAPGASAPDPGDLDRAGPHDPAQLNFTSGSTGRPKGVVVTHENILRLVQRCAFADLGPRTVMLHAASPAFDATTLEVWGPLVNGGAIAPLAARPDPDAVAAAVAAHGVTTLWLTAGLFHALVDQRPDTLSLVAHVLAGGDVVSPAHVARALAALPAGGRFSNGYGPTEGTTFTTTWTVRAGDRVAGPLPIGHPVPGTACYVMDARGRPLPDGVEGELWIGGAGVAAGYWQDEAETARRFVDGPGGRCYRSGDRVRRRPSDGALEFRGRLDDQMKIRGVRVEPAEIEAVLRDHPSVADAAVLARDSDDRLVAYVVARAGAAAPSPASLRAHTVARLPAAMVPAAWVRMPALPLTANGKLARERLPAPTREHYARSNGRGRRRSDPLEREAIAAFEAVLELRPVEADDDFFALGGHSLLALALCAELRRRTGTPVEPATVFAAPTPRALAAVLARSPGDGRRSTLVELRREGARPPLFLVTAGDGNPLAFAGLTRRLDPGQPVYALQPRGLDGHSSFDRSIPALAERYLAEVRRTQPRGPYLIAGRCNGATVATAIAADLRAGGEEVALVAVLDSEAPQVGPREIVPGVRRDRLVDIAAGAARREGEAVPDGGPALLDWLRRPLAPGVTRYLLAGLRRRADLRAAFPDPTGADADALTLWAWSAGVREGLYAPELLAPAGAVAAPSPYLLAVHAEWPHLRACVPRSVRRRVPALELGRGRARGPRPDQARDAARPFRAARAAARPGAPRRRRRRPPRAGRAGAPRGGTGAAGGGARRRRAARPRPAADARGAERGEGGARRLLGRARAGPDRAPPLDRARGQPADGGMVGAGGRRRRRGRVGRRAHRDAARARRGAHGRGAAGGDRRRPGWGACDHLKSTCGRGCRGWRRSSGATSAPSRRSSWARTASRGWPAASCSSTSATPAGTACSPSPRARSASTSRSSRTAATCGPSRSSACPPRRPAGSRRPRRTSATRSSTACGCATRRG